MDMKAANCGVCKKQLQAAAQERIPMAQEEKQEILEHRTIFDFVDSLYKRADKLLEDVKRIEGDPSCVGQLEVTRLLITQLESAAALQLTLTDMISGEIPRD